MIVPGIIRCFTKQQACNRPAKRHTPDLHRPTLGSPAFPVAAGLQFFILGSFPSIGLLHMLLPQHGELQHEDRLGCIGPQQISGLNCSCLPRSTSIFQTCAAESNPVAFQCSAVGSNPYLTKWMMFCLSAVLRHMFGMLCKVSAIVWRT